MQMCMDAQCPKTVLDTTIPVLGPAKIPSPLPYCRFDSDAKRIRVELDASEFEAGEGTCCAEFEVAGPRERIYFDSSKVKAAIVTCGGLCPGLNDVIRAIVMAEGDFTRTLDIDQKDEIGLLASSLNEMVGKLRDVVAEVQSASENVASGSEELSASAQSMGAGPHYHLPFPFESVKTPKVSQVRRVEVGFRSTYARDGSPLQTRPVNEESLMK